MHRPTPTMTVDYLKQATWRAQQRIKAAIKLAQELQQDPRSADRLAAQECRTCYYIPGLGGAAMTTQACMCCGTEQQFSSTNTDVLCPNCAAKHNLCKHCGGDLASDTARSSWPTREIA